MGRQEKGEAGEGGRQGGAGASPVAGGSAGGGMAWGAPCHRPLLVGAPPGTRSAGKRTSVVWPVVLPVDGPLEMAPTGEVARSQVPASVGEQGRIPWPKPRRVSTHRLMM